MKTETILKKFKEALGGGFGQDEEGCKEIDHERFNEFHQELIKITINLSARKFKAFYKTEELAYHYILQLIQEAQVELVDLVANRK